MANKKRKKFGKLPVGMFLIFLYLKLAEIGVVVNWSWWWVASPIWIALLLMGIVFLLKKDKKKAEAILKEAEKPFTHN